MRARTTLAVITALALGLLVAGCSGGSSSSSGSSTSTAATAVKNGGLLRVGATSTWDSINPFVAFNTLPYLSFSLTYPTLVQYDRSFKLVGDWASNWDVSDDGTTYTFKVQPGKWSDGQPLTAEDAAWTGTTILKYAKGATAYLAPVLSHAVSVTAPDPQMVQITYDKRVPNALPQLQQFFILPKHIWESHEGNNGKDLRAFNPAVNGAIVGGGAFFIDTFSKKGTTIFKRNDGFYGTKPHLDAIGITYYQNSDAMLAAFNSKDIDQMYSVPYLVADKLKDDGSVQVQSGDGTEVRDLGINSNQKKPKHRELLDPKVREAIAMSIDRSQIIDVVFAGYAKPAWSILTPLSAPYLNTDLEPEPHDIDAANQILDGLGYKRDAQGIRVVPATTGKYAEPAHRMSYDIITPTSLYGIDREFDIVRGGLKQIGIQVSQNALDDTTAFEEIGAPNWTYLNYDLMMWDWIGYIDPDYMMSVATCGQIGNLSDTAYCNPEYDNLYKAQSVAATEDERKDMIWRMQEMMYRDKPYVQLAQVDLVTAYHKGWGGLAPPFLFTISKLPWIEIGKTG